VAAPAKYTSSDDKPVTFLEACEVWDRQPGESVKAYTAFQVFKNLPLKIRSLVKVAQIAQRPTGLISKWADEHNWMQRAKHWDEYQVGVKALEALKNKEEMQERHATLACMVQQKLVERLNSLTPEQIDRMTFDQMSNLLKTAVQIEIRARGEPDTIVKSESKSMLTGPQDGPVRVEVIETLVRSRKDVEYVLQHPSGELLE
jgi:hypothetical protein